MVDTIFIVFRIRKWTFLEGHYCTYHTWYLRSSVPQHQSIVGWSTQSPSQCTVPRCTTFLPFSQYIPQISLPQGPECLFPGYQILLILQAQLHCQLHVCPSLTRSAQVVGSFGTRMETYWSSRFGESSLMVNWCVCLQNETVNAMKQRLF